MWQGSAFDCAREEILLRHSQFHLGTAIGQCNDGAIIGRGIQDTESGFTSQLNVTFTSNLNGKTVECIYDNGTTNIIGNTTFNINTGRLFCLISKYVGYTPRCCDLSY